MVNSLQKVLFTTFKDSRRQYASIYLAMFSAGIYYSLAPYQIKLIIDKAALLLEHPEISSATIVFAGIGVPLLAYVFLSFGVSLLFRFVDWMALQMIPKMKAQISTEFFTQLESKEYRYFQKYFAGSLASKVEDLVKGIPLILENCYRVFFLPLMTLIIITLTLLTIHPVLAAILSIWAVGFVAVSIYCAKRAEPLSASCAQMRTQCNGTLVDTLTNIINIKLFTREVEEASYQKKVRLDLAEKDKALRKYLFKVNLGQSLAIGMLVAAIAIFFFFAIQHRLITPGDFALIFALSRTIIDQAFFVSQQAVSLTEEWSSCQQALNILLEEVPSFDSPTATPVKINEGSIKFDRVSFAYPNGKPIFDKISFQIMPGEKVGIVGSSGCGKSTMINLLLKFQVPQNGLISIDGTPLGEIEQCSLRQQVALIPQEILLFNRSVLDNMRYGNPSATQEEILTAAKQSHCDKFIAQLSEGYDTLVGERGTKLSGGQRQRLAIARALLKEAPILIFDEATANLDSESEQYIQLSLAALMQQRTTIVIAHRLTTLLAMDRIFVFDGGHLAEVGSHQMLMRRGGIYAKLWAMQFGDRLLFNEAG